MAQFDISQTVNNILSSGGAAGQQVSGTVIRTAADMARVPGVDVANLASLPGVGAALGAALGVAEEALDLGGALVPGVRTPRAPEPRQIQKREFNPFNLRDVRGAAALASKLIEIADRKGGDAGLADAIGAVASLGEVLGEVSGLAGALVDDLTSDITRGLVGEVVNEVVGEVGADVLGLMGLREHALRLFITHHPTAHEQVKVQPIEVRAPNLISRFGSLVTKMDPSGKEIPSDENKVSFWREDALLNDHHGQWHAVYPTSPVKPAKLGDRNGELFAYMHMQMLARYDAERLGVGLERVKPFVEYKAPIPEGYTPGERVMASRDGGQTWIHFRRRPAGVQIGTKNANGEVVTDPTIEQLMAFREPLIAAAEGGSYAKIKGKPPISIDNFGNTIEASAGSVDAPDNKNYGNYHADGHTHFALFDNTEPIGVMLNLSTTSRDPIFWRWHKYVDTIIQKARVTVGKKKPHDFTRGPKVTVRNEDIIVCGRGVLPVDVDSEKLGAKAFGYSENATENRWDTDFSSGSATVTLSKGKTVTVTTTDELWTEMRKRTIKPLDPVEPVNSEKTLSEDIDYLSHEDFSYFIRLQNDLEQAQQVTIRIFLTPEEWVETNDNTTWIEMDRFLCSLEGRERAVVFRPARLSAVIRKPAVGHEELERTEPPRSPATSWCDCGWPYTLLLPRGTEKGLDFRLLVMLTSNDLAMDDTGQKCTSMSYCGLQDEKYPDSLPMGYPFDRPLTDNISSIINKHQNWASRKIRIRCRTPL